MEKSIEELYVIAKKNIGVIADELGSGEMVSAADMFRVLGYQLALNFSLGGKHMPQTRNLETVREAMDNLKTGIIGALEAEGWS